MGGYALPSLLIFMVVNACINKGIVYTLYAAIFIVLFVKIRRAAWFDPALSELGKQSTSMWFVYSYFCYYLFKDFIYDFRYPIVIFTALLTISYLTAITIDYLNKLMQRKFSSSL